ncbi:hypothetical protein NDK25_27900 [Niallia taxi]|nr:hypothetical protein [Niallia taxi]MDE5056019.1 hypothetical protein [Niallia taxi]
MKEEHSNEMLSLLNKINEKLDCMCNDLQDISETALDINENMRESITELERSLLRMERNIDGKPLLQIVKNTES